MNKRMRLTPAEAQTLLGGSPAEKSKARQLARSENDRWKELSELRIEVHQLQVTVAALVACFRKEMEETSD